jgi:hypothetical protein
MASVHLNTQQFQKDFPSFKPLEGSYCRKVHEIFVTVVCNFWRSLASYFQSAPLSQETKAKLNQPEMAQLLACRELRHKRMIGPTSILEVCTRFRETYSNIHFEPNFMFHLGSSELESHQTASLVLLPVVLKNGLRDHVVAVVYDRKANRVELYDPKGLTSADRSELARCSVDMRLSDVLQQVAQTYGNKETKLWENSNKHQYDSHNCGIYVLNYFERRLNNETPEQIACKGANFSDANNSLREHYLNWIL